jgi:hypothetical protein
MPFGRIEMLTGVVLSSKVMYGQQSNWILGERSKLQPLGNLVARRQNVANCEHEFVEQASVCAVGGG